MIPIMIYDGLIEAHFSETLTTYRWEMVSSGMLVIPTIQPKGSNA
jgi:hypothetical protein